MKMKIVFLILLASASHNVCAMVVESRQTVATPKGDFQLIRWETETTKGQMPVLTFHRGDLSPEVRSALKSGVRYRPVVVCFYPASNPKV